MVSEEFLSQVLGVSPGEYVSLAELVDDQILHMLASQAAEKSPRLDASDEVVQDIIDSTRHIHLKIPEAGDDSEDLPSVGPKKFEEALQENWEQIHDQVFLGVTEKANEEFPVRIDLFKIGGIVFAYEISDKEESLSNVLDWLVEKEEYEKAVTVRDALEDLGSDKVKQNQ